MMVVMSKMFKKGFTLIELLVVIGVLAIVSAFWTTEKIQKSLTQVVAIIALFFAAYGFLVASSPPPNTFGVANLENPYDNLLHLAVAVWAGYVGFLARP